MSDQIASEIEAVDTIELPPPGTKQRGWLRFSHWMLAGWTWPMVVARGATDGPRLALISGVHPAEYPAIEANIRFMRQLDPAKLAGTIVSLPVLDLPAWLPRTPFVCPIDGKNPNRCFPGSPTGTFSEVMVNAIFQAVIAPADALIDLHGGDMVEALVPFSISSVSGNAEVDAQSAAIGRAFGLPYLVANRPRPGGLGGTSIQAAAAAGIPGIIAEAGGCGLLTEPETQLLSQGIENALRHLGMLEGTPRPPDRLIEIERNTWLYAPAEGMWYPSVQVGETVREGQTLGVIRNLFGDHLADVTAPHDGHVLFVTTSPAMRKDGILLAVGG
jgi:predicted deacylase